MSEKSLSNLEKEEARIEKLIEELYAPYFEDNYDEPWYRGEEPTEEEEEEIEDKLHDAVGERFECIGSARGEISGGGLGWTVRMTYWMWPEPVKDGKSWYMHALWFNDDGMQWEFNRSGYVSLENGSFAKAAYEMLKAEKPTLDGDEDNQKVDLEVEQWRRLSLGLPKDPRMVGPYVDSTRRWHRPYRWSIEASAGNQRFGSEDWRILTQMGYALAKADGILHPGEDRSMMKWWKEAARRYYDYYTEAPLKPITRAFEEWDEEGVQMDGDLRSHLWELHRDKRVRMVQLLHKLSLVDGRTDPMEMEWIEAFAKELRVSLDDPMVGAGNRGALTDWRRMRDAEGDPVALAAFAPSTLFLPLPVIEVALGGASSPWLMDNEMALGWLGLEFKPGYRLTLILGSDEEGCYLRAEDSMQVTWPERRISVRATMGEAMDYLIGQEGYMLAYPHEDAHDPDRHDGVPSPLSWILGEVDPKEVDREQDFRGIDVIRCQSERRPLGGAAGFLKEADEQMMRCRDGASHSNGLDLLVSSECWPLAQSLVLHFKGQW